MRKKSSSSKMPGDNPAEGEPLVAAAEGGDGQQVADAAANVSIFFSFLKITNSA